MSADYTIPGNNSSREIALTTLFTYQSGHWETVAAGKYQGFLIREPDKVSLSYMTTIHNYEMPAYIRLDFGCRIKYSDDEKISW